MKTIVINNDLSRYNYLNKYYQFMIKNDIDNKKIIIPELESYKNKYSIEVSIKVIYRILGKKVNYYNDYEFGIYNLELKYENLDKIYCLISYEPYFLDCTDVKDHILNILKNYENKDYIIKITELKLRYAKYFYERSNHKKEDDSLAKKYYKEKSENYYSINIKKYFNIEYTGI